MYGAWVDRFGGRPEIVGSTLSFNDAPHTVVGVLPGDFEVATKGSSARGRTMYDAWVPLALDPARLQRGTHPLRVYARLLCAGLLLGLLASAALTRTMTRLLYDVAPLHPQIFAMVPALLMAIGFVASYIPARRAPRTDPALAHRAE